MIRSIDLTQANNIRAGIDEFSRTIRNLPGVPVGVVRETYIAQLIESIRRVKFVTSILHRPIHPSRSDPYNDLFDPLKAAVIHWRNENKDEAFWLVFLSIHFGKHAVDGWKLLQAVYGRCGVTPPWTWDEIVNNKRGFRSWLRDNQIALASLRFGNHRKFESIRVDSSKGLANVIDGYLNWVGPPRTHMELFDNIIGGTNDPEIAFDRVYKSASSIFRWGRLSKFDHLAMLGKLGFLNLQPGTAYLRGASGPMKGARLLLTGSPVGDISVNETELTLSLLGKALGVGQQEIEDSLCNWQKSPSKFIAFR